MEPQCCYDQCLVVVQENSQQKYPNACFCEKNHRHNALNIAGISRLSSVMILQPDQVVLSTNLFFKLDVSLPLVTGELFQNAADVTSVKY